MDKVISYNFGCDIIPELADYILTNYKNPENDYTRIGVVFGGKRPALFLKRELARKLNSAFYPPRCFSIEEFLNYLISKKEIFRYGNDLEFCYWLYQLCKEKSPQILNGREKFYQFLPWAREILSFLEILDMEDVDNSSLLKVKLSAEIGYEVPRDINEILKSIVALRDEFHRKIEEKKLYPRGYTYLKASRLISEIDFLEFEIIVFCGFFYLHNTEIKIVKKILHTDKGMLILQTDNRSWPVLKKLEAELEISLTFSDPASDNSSISILRGFDIHSQAGLVREILKNEEIDYNHTVIVLPQEESLLPLLSELSSIVNDFNVSLGYPLKRSTIFSLLNTIFKAQLSKGDDGYYTRDYLRVLTHPLIKNLNFTGNPAITRILVHKVEEFLTGIEKGEISGSLFATLDEIENFQPLYLVAQGALNRIGILITPEELAEMLKELHRLGFRIWEQLSNFEQLASALEMFLDAILHKSMIEKSPLDVRAMEKIYELKDALKTMDFKHEIFPQDELFKIFNDKLENESISFLGSPLKGLQILGLYETRALSFRNVIVIDVNESVLPKLKVYEPLIPRQIMLELGLNRLEVEEEIQRYHFRRLIKSARQVYLIYDDRPDKERSRFIEEIIWEEERKQGKLNVISQPRGAYRVEVGGGKYEVEKSDLILKGLREFVFSPSSIDVYLNCPLQFYYQYLLNLEEKEDLLQEPQAVDIGRFLHKLLEESFLEFVDRKPKISRKFREKFFKEFETRFREDYARRLGPEAFLVEYIMKYRLQRFLDNEQKRSGEIEKILSLEQELVGKIRFRSGEVKFKCIIDRLEQLTDGTLLIIDYKTGGSAEPPHRLSGLQEMELSREDIRKRIHSFQLPIYYHFIKEKYPQYRINAALYSLRNTEMSQLFRKEDYGREDEVIDYCFQSLEFIISEILSPEIPFTPDTSNPRICRNCPYTYLCK
jgi:CRISPR/Cas system-associated exonuclease Cas4 (RecB family)